MSAVAIHVEHVSKAYLLGAKQRHHRLSELMVDLARGLGSVWNRGQDRSPYRTHDSDVLWALDDVSFEVPMGDVVGIIGSNGAGKSTLLKIMTRIVHPTSGRLKLRGRIGSLLEVGTGFHPELTGRENVYLAGAVLGMSRKETARKFDAIVEFSGIERFIDTPVKRYSSGMHVRLGFSVAAHLDPEIMILDEVLSVGDADFQRKCQAKFKEIRRSGCTIVVVSHNMNQIATLCQRVIWLKGGRVVEIGDAHEVVRSYFASTTRQADEPAEVRTEWPRNDEVRIHGLALYSGERLVEAGMRDVDIERELTLRIDYEVLQSNLLIVVRSWLLDLYGTEILGSSTAVRAADDGPLVEAGSVPGRYRAECRIPARLLNDIDYRWRVAIRNLVTEQQITIDNALPFHGCLSEHPESLAKPFAAGLFRPDVRWEVKRISD